MQHPIISTNSLTIDGSLLTPAYMAPFRPKYGHEITYGEAYLSNTQIDHLNNLAKRYGFRDAAEVDEIRSRQVRTGLTLIERIRGVPSKVVSDYNRPINIARDLWAREI
jgi:hypothetical protein